MLISDNHLDILCCPTCGSDLEIALADDKGTDPGRHLRCNGCGKIYNFFIDYPDFLHVHYLQHPDKWIKFLLKVYSKVYKPATNLMFVICGGVDKAKREVLNKLDIRKGDRILETGIGACDNLPYLKEIFGPCKYYGHDIQKQKLKLCKKNLEKWGMEAWLCLADAEALPYRNESFDSVFHLGAINLFLNKKKAIDEMIRVARPGTKIVIADESEKAAKLLTVVMGKQEKVVPPLDLIPENMEDIRLHEIWKGYGYLIEFRKPG